MVLSSLELSAQRAAQARSHNAVVTLHRGTSAVDDVGDQADTFVDTEDVPCGFAFESGSRREGPELVVIEYDATLRLPVDVELHVGDEVTLTELAGLTYSIRFELVKEPVLGTTSNNVLLRKLVTEAE